MIENTVEIKKEIATFYENLYAETKEWRPHLEMENCPRISWKASRRVQGQGPRSTWLLHGILQAVLGHY